MTFTYIPGTPAGTVRLLCTDRDPDYEIFSDEEVEVFLSLNDQDVKLAGAQALDVIASTQALILKYIEVNGLKTDGSKVAAALHQQAEALRAQAADDGDEEAFDVVGGAGPYLPYGGTY